MTENKKIAKNRTELTEKSKKTQTTGSKKDKICPKVENCQTKKWLNIVRGAFLKKSV